MAVNAAACRLLIQSGIKAVVILWDSANSKMAVKAAPKGEPNSFTVTFAADLHAGSFRAKSFFDHIGWHAKQRIALPTTWSAAEKMFEVSLPTQHLGSDEVPKKKNRFG